MDIIVFGDSITYGKWDSQGGWVQRLRRYLDEKYLANKDEGFHQVYNMGIPGELASRMHKRVEAELIDRLFKNTLIILAIGINDSCTDNWMSGMQTPDEDFREAIKKIVHIVQEKKCKLVAVGLTPTNGKNRQNFNEGDVKKYDLMLTDVYNELSIPKLELYDELVNDGFMDMLVDGVHPNDQGHELLFMKIRAFLQNENLL